MIKIIEELVEAGNSVTIDRPENGKYLFTINKFEDNEFQIQSFHWDNLEDTVYNYLLREAGF